MTSLTSADGALKLSTFKVADEYRGTRYGELLLKAVFAHIARDHDDHAWVTVFPCPPRPHRAL